MKLHPFLTILTGSLALGGPLHASLSDQLFAYYDFEDVGTPGLVNKAPGATGTDAVRYSAPLAVPPIPVADFDSSGNPSGPGFAGMATFTSTIGTSNRGTLLVGKALNLSDDRNDAIQLPYGPTQLGGNFTISAWHYLAPGSTSATTRFHVFESNVSYDITWGTAAASRENFLSYLNAGAQSPGTTLAQNAWHHVVQTFSSDGTTTTLNVYVDGVYRHTQTAPTAELIFANINFGRARDGITGRSWDGMLDEIAIWKRALTATEVRELTFRGTHGVNLTAPYVADTDGDGLTDLAEFVTHGTDPALADTDGDGITDGAEINGSGTNPLVSDASLVAYVNAQLQGAPLGTLDLTTGFTRNAQAGTVALSVKADVSTDDVTYTPQPFNGAGASVTPDGDGVKVSLPAAPAGPQFYRFFVK